MMRFNNSSFISFIPYEKNMLCVVLRIVSRTISKILEFYLSYTTEKKACGLGWFYTGMFKLL